MAFYAVLLGEAGVPAGPVMDSGDLHGAEIAELRVSPHPERVIERTERKTPLFLAEPA